jgi:hypothetical protein
MKDNMTFRPSRQPAQRLFDAFQDEAKNRTGNWEHKERLRMFREARDYAHENGLKVPTMDQIRQCESMAIGHTDYAARWAYGISDLLEKDSQ